jgi:methyl-accepting chemotaxis protein
MWIRNPSIRHTLPLTIGVGLFLFCVAILLYTLTLRSTIAEYEHLLASDIGVRYHASRVVTAVLHARKAEKDFFSRNDPALADAVATAIQRAIDEARTIQQLSQGTAEADAINSRLQLIAHLEQYAARFQRVAQAWKERGLDYQSGVQGTLRTVARAMETGALATVPGATPDYLTLRRLEKDYLLRQDMEYLAELATQGAALLQRVQKSALAAEARKTVTEQLRTYLATMEQLGALDQRIRTELDAMRAVVRQVEPLADDISAIADRQARDAAEATRQFADNSAQGIFILSVVAILGCGVISISMVRSIVGAISALWRFSHEVATGNLDATITMTRKDEIGHLAAVMTDMVNRMRAMRLIADRMVMIMALIGRGAIPEPVEVNFQGDFQRMTDALNDMIRRLRELRLIATHMDQISQGEIPAPLTGDFQGDFRRMADAINVILDKLQEIGGLGTQTTAPQSTPPPA